MIQSTDKKNILVVITSNFLTLITNVLLCLLFPKVIDVQNYALYKVYTLYITYNGFFHFGFINGIYLKYGNYNYSQLPKPSFRYYHRVMILISLISYAILFALLLPLTLYTDSSTFITMVFVAINIPILNMRAYYSLINQFTKNFVRDSHIIYIQNILTFLMIAIVTIFHCHYYIFLLIMTTVTNCVTTLLILQQNKTLIVGNIEKKPLRHIFELIKNGFVFMFSEYIGLLIIGLDSIFISVLYSSVEFAMYSFAATIIAGLYAFISVISNLIYPYLVRTSSQTQTKYYNSMSDVLTIATSLMIAIFFLVKWFVYKYIPTYIPSLSILAILFGIVIFRSLLLLVCCNYFKVLKLTKAYYIINVITIVLSFILNIIAHIMSHNYYYIAVASLISFVIWYTITELFLMRRLHNPLGSGVLRYLLLFFSLTTFYIIVYLDFRCSFIVYVTIALGLVILLYHKKFATIFSYIKQT